MKRYWSRALFQKDLATLATFAGLIFFIIILNVIYPIVSRLATIKELASYGNLKEEAFRQWFGEILLVGEPGNLIFISFVLIISLVINLFNHDRKENTGELLASMPFTKKQTIGTKWFAGMLTIATPFLLAFAILSLLYWANIDWIDSPYRNIPAWATMNLLLGLTIYNFLFFVQTLMGHNTFAGVIGGICTVIPWFILMAVPWTIRAFFITNHHILQAMENLAPKTLIWGVLNYGRIYSSEFGNYYHYPNFILRASLLLLGIAVLYWISERAFMANRVEKNGQLLMFDFLEPVLVWGFAICLGLFLLAVFGLGYGTLASLVYLILGTALGYFIAYKTVAYYKR